MKGKSRVHRIPWRLFIAVGFLLASTACATLEPPQDEYGSVPTDMLDRSSQAREEKSQQGRALDREKTGEEKNATQVLEKIQKQNEEFNQRLASIIEDSDRTTGPSKEPDKDQKDDRSGGQEVSFNFYDADLVEVIRVFMDLLDEDYILHSNVQGRVTLSVNDTFRQDQMLDLLRGVLRINSMTMIQGEDGVWEILPMTEASRQLSEERIFLPPDQDGRKRGQIIQVFRLRYIAANEMIKIIKPYLTQNASIYAHDANGILLISDYPHALTKVEQMVAMFDESVFADIHARVYTLKNAEAEEAVSDLQKVAQKFGLGEDRGGPSRRVAFVPLARTNTVVAITRDPQVTEFIDAWVEELDKKVPAAASSQQDSDIFVYYVQYGDADKIIQSLQGVFEGGAEEKEKETRTERVAGEEVQESEVETQKQGNVSARGELSGPVTFQFDETTNSILTKCTAQDYQKILSVIEKLDQYPKQVFIEMVIAEVGLDDSSKLGVEWRYLMDLGSTRTGELTVDTGLGQFSDSSRIGSGLSYLIESTNRLTASLKALAESGQVQILSTPTLLASDNKQATINIGDEVPIPTTSERRRDVADAEDEVVTTTLQYRDTGIILDVTPKINKQGMVRMEVSQEVSNLTEEQVEGITAPVISTRSATTSVAVNDGQTIVIGGLIKQTRQRNKSGVPYLQNIPGLGYLFRYQGWSYEKTELMIFITPHVVLSVEDTEFITKDFKHRLDEIKQKMF